MAYKIADTSWKFTTPQEGEVDSAEKVAEMLTEIDAALLDPGKKAQLTSQGADQSTVTDQSSEFYDPSFVYDSYKGKYVTSLHEHPTPESVPNADHAEEADHAAEADRADSAGALSPGGTINGHTFTGVEDVVVKNDDIPDSVRVFYGTQDPSDFGGFPSVLRNGDLYVKITE